MIQIGTRAKLKIPCMRNPTGTIGICFEIYNIGDNSGASFIFPNSSYDGFSSQEVEEFLEFYDNGDLQYEFTNVNQLMKDFHNGMFNKYFKETYEKHPTIIKGYNDLKDIAEDIGNLNYYSLLEVMKHLQNKFKLDAKNDFKKGRKQLSHALTICAEDMKHHIFDIENVIKHCKKHMKDVL
jgi:uncharacterized protein YktA (UPF0223 family)